MIRKHSVSLNGHRTSFSLEDDFLAELKRIAAQRGMPLAALLAEIDRTRPPETNLSSALRLYVLDDLKRMLSLTAAAAGPDRGSPPRPG